MRKQKYTVVTYNDLINEAVATIKSALANVDRYDIPVEARSGWNVDMKGNPGGGVRIKIDESTIIRQVSSGTVEADLINFLKNRNVFSKLNILVTVKGILLFWNAICSFCNSNVCVLQSQFASYPVLVYVSNNRFSYMPNVQDNNTPTTGANVNTLLTNLEETLSNTTRVFKVNYIYTPYATVKWNKWGMSQQKKKF